MANEKQEYVEAEGRALDALVKEGKTSKTIAGTIRKMLPGFLEGNLPKASFEIARDSLLAVAVKARGEGHDAVLRVALEKSGQGATVKKMDKVAKLVEEIAIEARKQGKAYRIVVNKYEVKKTETATN